MSEKPEDTKGEKKKGSFIHYKIEGESLYVWALRLHAIQNP